MSTSAQAMAALKLASGLTGNNGTLGNTFGGAGNSLGILSGLQQGGVRGYTNAALNAGKLAGRFTGDPTINQGVGALANAYNIYNGLQQGGVAGYGGAAASAGQLAGNLLNNPALSTVSGYVAAPLALYNFGKNWKSGATGSDAASGVAAGAAVGSVVPVVGTALGALIGGAGGALSSAFGPGAIDPETHAVQGLLDYVGANPQQGKRAASQIDNPYLGLAGLMDRRESTLPMYQQYGRAGEQKFATDLTGNINDAFTAGKGIDTGPLKGDVWSKDPSTGNYILTTPTGGKTIVPASEAASQVYNSTVDPWVSGMGSGWNNVGSTYQDTTKGLLTDMVSQYMSGQAPTNWKAIGGDSPFANLTSFAGGPTPPTTGAPATAAATTPSLHQGATQVLAAEGGLMKKKRSALRAAYSPAHFDEGGDVGDSLDYFTPTAGGNTPYEFNDPSMQDLSGYFDSSNPLNGLNMDLGNAGENVVNVQNDPSAYGVNSGGGSSGGGGALSALQSLVQQHPSLQYAALLPLLSGLFGGSSQAKAPATPPGFSPGVASTMGAPTSMRTQNQMNPNTDWYTYGQHPEASFYSNNQLPFIPGYSPSSTAPQQPQAPSPTGAPNMNAQPLSPGLQGRAVMAHGGALSSTFDSSQQSYVPDPGHGDGTSDDVNAKVSGGEYVMDGGTVSMLGNGSNEAGARRLDELRQRLRKDVGKTLVKGKQFMKAKKPEQYLRKTGTGG